MPSIKDVANLAGVGGRRMKYTKLGQSGLHVSRLCLATINFGEFTDEKEEFRNMDVALDAGGNFFDTANYYGGSGENCGRTERFIGQISVRQKKRGVDRYDFSNS